MKNATFAVYKPKGPTSNDIVQQIKRCAGEKVGHAGTLDPLARGVLVMGVGREATKKLSEIVQKEKEYIAVITLGATSTTDDAEGEKTTQTVSQIPTRGKTEKILLQFSGTILQVPPRYSAIKIRGKEAYKRARKGEAIIMRPREVFIQSIEVLVYEWPLLTVKTITGPGVYIRSLARDIGAALGTGGYLADLERTRVGQFTKEEALTPEEACAKFSDTS